MWACVKKWVGKSVWHYDMQFECASGYKLCRGKKRREKQAFRLKIDGKLIEEITFMVRRLEYLKNRVYHKVILDRR